MIQKKNSKESRMIMIKGRRKRKSEEKLIGYKFSETNY